MSLLFIRSSRLLVMAGNQYHHINENISRTLYHNIANLIFNATNFCKKQKFFVL